MPMTLGELADAIKATLARGERADTIRGIASLTLAGEGQLAPYVDAQYHAQLAATKASAVLCKSADMAAEAPAGAAILCAADPEMALIAALHILYPEKSEAPGIDPKAAVEAGAEIGAGAHVGPYAVVRADAKVGPRCVIHAHAVIGRGCVLGEDSVIHPNVTLYDGVQLGKRVIVHSGAVLGADGFGYKFRGGRHVKVPQVGPLVLGDDVEIGANTCIDRGALSATRVGDGTKIDNLVQIGHNNEVGKHCILCGQVALAGSCVLDDYVVLGGNVGVADHIHMGKGSKAGAKSGIGKDVPPGMEVWGMYAEERRNAFKSLAAYRKLPEFVERIRELEAEVKRLRGEHA
jgi:UDP-3-O-[3-hydroxymyristoyl] glucosamine N-acyltransferase